MLVEERRERLAWRERDGRSGGFCLCSVHGTQDAMVIFAGFGVQGGEVLEDKGATQTKSKDMALQAIALGPHPT